MSVLSAESVSSCRIKDEEILVFSFTCSNRMALGSTSTIGLLHTEFSVNIAHNDIDTGVGAWLR